MPSQNLLDFLDLGSLAHTVSQVVELSSANLTAADHFHAGNSGGMNGEYLLDTNAVSNSAYGEGLSDTAMLLGDYSTLKGLDSLSAAFLDLNADTNSVTNVYDRKVLLSCSFLP